jgi:hypothetical protein
MTPLMWAAVHGRTSCARMLIDAGADKEAQDMVRLISHSQHFWAFIVL